MKLDWILKFTATPSIKHIIRNDPNKSFYQLFTLMHGRKIYEPVSNQGVRQLLNMAHKNKWGIAFNDINPGKPRTGEKSDDVLYKYIKNNL